MPALLGVLEQDHVAPNEKGGKEVFERRTCPILVAAQQQVEGEKKDAEAKK